MITDTHKPLAKPPLEGYYSRTIAYLCVALTFSAVLVERGHQLAYLISILYALAYPQLAHLISRKVPPQNSTTKRLTLLALDAVHTGAFMAVLGFTVVPSLMFFLLVGFSCLIAGGSTYLIAGSLLTIAGALLGAAAFQPQLVFASSNLVTLVSLISGGFFLLIVAAFVHRQGRHLEQAQQQLQREQEKTSRLAANLSKYLSPQVWESIFSGKRSARLETRRKKLTVFFSDIRGFTELAEELEAEALTDLLNNYLDEMSRIALQYGGTIDKFVGDCVMVFFGDPSTRGAKQDAEAAVSMAIAMRKHMKVLRQQWRSRGITKPLEIRMGLSTGYCTVGNFGTATRMDYTIIGREVNLASRLEGAADAGEILISHETYSLVKELIMCRDKGQISVKGFSRPVQIYEVVGLRRELGAAPTYVEHELTGFSMYLDTTHVRNYDKEQIIKALEQAARKLRDKVIV